MRKRLITSDSKYFNKYEQNMTNLYIFLEKMLLRNNR